jgi:hypothetical protein
MLPCLVPSGKTIPNKGGTVSAFFHEIGLQPGDDLGEVFGDFFSGVHSYLTVENTSAFSLSASASASFRPSMLSRKLFTQLWVEWTLA